MFSILSLALGLCAWAIPLITVSLNGQGKLPRSPLDLRIASPIASMSACAVALMLQFFDVRRWVLLGDHAALGDVVPSLAWVALILTVVCVGLNLLALASSQEYAQQRG